MSEARRLLIVMVNSDPRNGEELGAPFYQASVAAVLGYEVDVVCTATAGRLLRKGVAETIEVKPGSGKTVYDFIRDAHANGARFWACPANLDLFGMAADDLIPECAGMMSTTQMIVDMMDSDCRVLSY
ncbi:DsrE/DsrF/DrsH-like family protein [Alsobacter sp. SYSU M60028]|uniref:DsrE/DsrF/DrsH-like family protein n=1 Tax=Alsobacter ponti TaxID=2962936 RepID=A0ABT1L804_9HYPH|nr:DsrE/DsrF/DrsH-like family protein [Alsobacter ponti]MCP8937567.1 DsrE/DsrF/DrsH-like family protein [Alsobacter ponti]